MKLRAILRRLVLPALVVGRAASALFRSPVTRHILVVIATAGLSLILRKPVSATTVEAIADGAATVVETIEQTVDKP